LGTVLIAFSGCWDSDKERRDHIHRIYTQDLLRYVSEDLCYLDKIAVSADSENRYNAVNEAVCANIVLNVPHHLTDVIWQDYDKDGLSEICDYFGTPLIITTQSLGDENLRYLIGNGRELNMVRKGLPSENIYIVSLGPNRKLDNFAGDDVVLEIACDSIVQKSSHKLRHILSKFASVAEED
jgi:hypothetical protein